MPTEFVLHRRGALHDTAPITSSFCFGSTDLYARVDGDPPVRMLRTEKTNDPGSSRSSPR